MNKLMSALGMIAILASTGHATMHQIAIRGFAFEPATLSIASGDSVTWTNEDAAPHTATADDFSWTTGFLSTDESATVVFTEEGNEPYFCEVHPSMVASLEVSATGIGDGIPMPGAARTHLGSAQPNPFNPHTILPFTLTGEGQVTLGIHDSAGRLVRTLVDGRLPMGAHQVTFDGTTNGGDALPSGRYVARLTSGSTDMSTTLLLVR